MNSVFSACGRSRRCADGCVWFMCFCDDGDRKLFLLASSRADLRPHKTFILCVHKKNERFLMLQYINKSRLQFVVLSMLDGQNKVTYNGFISLRVPHAAKII